MSAVLALTRASWLTMSSYRVQFMLSMAGMLVSVVPLYFVANALQPVMAESISTQGGRAFDFLLVGTVIMTLVPVASTGLPNALSSGIRTGTLEAMIASPTSFASILTGLLSLQLLIAATQVIIVLVAGAMLGAEIAWYRALPGMLTIALIVAAYIPFALIGGALILLFRTAGPLSKVVMMVTALFGGVYYPTHVIPSWLEVISYGVPMTYGLRALRRILLEGLGIAAVATDLLILTAGTAVLLAIGFASFAFALKHARQRGNLAQY